MNDTLGFGLDTLDYNTVMLSGDPASVSISLLRAPVFYLVGQEYSPSTNRMMHSETSVLGMLQGRSRIQDEVSRNITVSLSNSSARAEGYGYLMPQAVLSGLDRAEIEHNASILLLELMTGDVQVSRALKWLFEEIERRNDLLISRIRLDAREGSSVRRVIIDLLVSQDQNQDWLDVALDIDESFSSFSDLISERISIIPWPKRKK